MTTQIIFKIDEKLKKSAQKKAKEQGITLSRFYQSATKSFVEGRATVGMITDFEGEDLSQYTNAKEIKASLNKALKQYPVFK